MNIIDAFKMIQGTYIPLVEAFLNHHISASRFKATYLEILKKDPIISYTDEMFEPLQAIFEDLDAYEEDPDPSEWPTEIDEAELREGCINNLAKLKAFVQEYEAQS